MWTNSEPNDDPAEFLELLGNKTRLQILVALRQSEPAESKNFTELYQCTDAAHTSGFSYHLEKLIPEFVRDSGEGYELTPFGKRVAKAILAGTFSESHRVNQTEIDGNCVVCGQESLVCSFDRGQFQVRCQSCTELIVSVIVPPRLPENRGTEMLVKSVDQWLTRWMQMSMPLFRESICEYCGGYVNSDVITGVDRFDRFDIALSFECTDCGSIQRSTIGAFASQHPEVKHFHYERHSQLASQRYWEVEQWMVNENLKILSEDPRRFRVTFDADGDTCKAIVNVDDGLEVVDVQVSQ